MKAIQVTEYGGPEVLKLVDIEVPKPEGKKVLIKIEAIGVNYADTARRENQYVIPTPLPFIPGAEVAGEVVALGDEVKGIEVGTKVVTLISSTGYAEYALADSRGLIPIPDGVDAKEAVALPLQGLTAYHIIKSMGRLEKGETVLVHAAAGGVGTLAVQLANLFGAGKVIGTASTEEKRQMATELGAHHTVDYTKEGWEQEVLDLTDGKGADVILEMAGGEVFKKSFKCLAPFGRMVVYGAASGERTSFYPSYLMGRNQSVIGFFLPQMMAKRELYQQSLVELLGFLGKGQLKLTIGGTYRLEEAAHVHEILQGRKTAGKLVLVP